MREAHTELSLSLHRHVLERVVRLPHCANAGVCAASQQGAVGGCECRVDGESAARHCA